MATLTTSLIPLIFAYPGRLLLVGAVHSSGYRCLRYGKCSLWGNPTFLEISNAAMESIKLWDDGLFSRLAASRYFFAQCADSPSFFLASKTFGISHHYERWGREGIIAYIIYAFNCVEMMEGNPFRMLNSKLYREADQITANWLIKNGIKTELAA